VVLQQVVGQYQAVDKQLNFDESAMALGIKPYQALIIASMIEGEAKFDADRAKVARVIYNRLAARQPLGIDATSVYEALLQGKDPRNISYTENSPYNTRKRPGLPPTAIDNPGEAAMYAAIHPAIGAWKYYVVADAQGHLFFTSSYPAFLQAKAKCGPKAGAAGDEGGRARSPGPAQPVPGAAQRRLPRPRHGRVDLHRDRLH
jgi:Predicted periplasmic solute-binding protein